jgi:chaperone required for assembly of F1-ATPase
MNIKVPPVFSVVDCDGFTVFRDAEALKTPRGLAVTVPTRALAQAIEQECRRQGEKLDLRQMPLTQMALTAIDISSHHSEDVVSGIMRYGESELVCQRADDPADLVAEQNRVWQPYLDWCKEKFGVELRSGSGIIPFAQKPETLQSLRDFVETFDAFRLTGLSEAVGVCGSLVLGLALATGRDSPEAVLSAAELDHVWQSKKWGDDPVTHARQEDIKRDLKMCAEWLGLLG